MEGIYFFGGSVILLIGLVNMIRAYWKYNHNPDYEQGAGTVIGNVDLHKEGKSYHLAIIEYVTGKGQTLEFKTKMPTSSWAPHKVGLKVKVVYRVDNPEAVELKHPAVSLHIMGLLVFGLLILLALGVGWFLR